MNQTLYDTWGTATAVTCSNNDSNVEDFRIHISVGLIEYNIIFSDIVDPPLDDIYQIVATTNLLCIPYFGTQTAEVTYTTNQTTGGRQVEVHQTSTHLQALEGLTSQELLRAVMESFEAATTVMKAVSSLELVPYGPASFISNFLFSNFQREDR